MLVTHEALRFLIWSLVKPHPVKSVYDWVILLEVNSG